MGSGGVVQLAGFEMSRFLSELVDKFGGQQERQCPALLFGGCQIFGGVSKKFIEKCWR